MISTQFLGLIGMALISFGLSNSFNKTLEPVKVKRRK